MNSRNIQKISNTISDEKFSNILDKVDKKIILAITNQYPDIPLEDFFKLIEVISGEANIERIIEEIDNQIASLDIENLNGINSFNQKIEEIQDMFASQEKNISFLDKRLDDINPTIQNNLRSFSEATKSYGQSAEDLRDGIRDLRERLRNLVTTPELRSHIDKLDMNLRNQLASKSETKAYFKEEVGKLKEDLPGKWERGALLLGVIAAVVTCIASIVATFSVVPAQFKILEELKKTSNHNELITPPDSQRVSNVYKEVN